MPYFVRIGVIPTNKRGVGSRGYQMFRRGRTIVVRWGAVEVRPHGRFFWFHEPQEKVYRHASESAAKRAIREMMRLREQTYSKLPRGVAIR
jgi:hypothetical protein